MVVDITMILNEIDVLQLRIWEMHEHVDMFIIVEARETFTGNPKKLYFEEVKNEPRFARFKDKIKYLIIDKFLPTNDVWCREGQQRNYAITSGSLDGLSEDTIIIASDADEIPNKAALREMVNTKSNECITTSLYWSHYYINFELPKTWCPGPKSIRLNKLRTAAKNDLQFLRCGAPTCEHKIIHNGGWHVAYTGRRNTVREKIASYSHTEINTEKRLDDYGRCVADKEVIWDTKLKLKYNPWNDNFPCSFRNDEPSLRRLYYPERAYNIENELRMTVNDNQESNRVLGIIELIHDWLDPTCTIVEIGSFEGLSTETFALFCGNVISIDPYTTIPSFGQESETMLINAEKTADKRLSIYKNIVRYKKKSLDVMAQMENKSVDAVYIDGDHRNPAVIADIREAIRITKDGGVVCGHDYYDSVKNSVDSIIGEPVKAYRDSSWAWVKNA